MEVNNWYPFKHGESCITVQEIQDFWRKNGSCKELLSEKEFEKRVISVTYEQLKSIIPQFLAGVTVIVDCSLTKYTKIILFSEL